MWEQNNSRLQIKPTDKSSTTLAEVKKPGTAAKKLAPEQHQELHQWSAQTCWNVW